MIKALPGARWLTRSLSIAFISLLAACSSVIDGFPERARPTADLEVLDYYDWARGATRAAREEEQARLRALVPEAAIATIQLVLLLSVAYADDPQAQEEAYTLLAEMEPAESVWYEGRRQDYLDFGAIWLEVLAERRTTSRGDETDTATLRQRIRELEAQIEALTDIEQQLIDRERLH